VLATILNIFGLDVGKWLNNIGAVSRWIVTLLLIALGVLIWHQFGPATTIDAASLHPGLRIQDVIFWSVIAFAWTGPESMGFMSGEVKNPRRSIPIGLAIAAPAIAAIYVLGTWSVMMVLKPADVNASSGVMQAIAGGVLRVGWSYVTPVAAILVTISCLGSCGAWLGAVARIPFVAGIDHFLPPVFGRMHPRWGSPVAALLAQAGIAVVFIFLGQGGTSVKGAYQVLVDSTVLITMVPFLFLFASTFRLYVDRATPEIIRIPGGKATVMIAAAIGFTTTLTSAVLAVFPADDEPNKPLAVIKVLGLTALMVGSGALVYALGRRNLAKARRSST
jgi:amino acid transporter